jgi:3-oxoacyl-[acyl-carrier protein] reductase
MKFAGQVVVVTGSSSGIGRATALRFAAAGAAVVVNSKQNATGGEAVAAAIAAQGGQALHVQADLGHPPQVRALCERTLAAFGTVDVLINNAGHTETAPFLEATKEHWLRAFDDNLFSAVLCAQAFAPVMLAKGRGKIINTASIRGVDYAGVKVAMAYSAAKAALVSFSKTLAKELAPHVNVNVVAPGFVRTENHDRMKPEIKERMLRTTPIGRFITTDEIADAFLFLAGADAVTGQVLLVDGGFTLKAT